MSYTEIKREFYAAIQSGDVALVKSMYEGDRELQRPTITSSYDMEASNDTPMHYAARCNNVGIMEVFYENKANVDINIPFAEHRLYTPLHVAAECGNTVAAKWLVDHGAIVDAGKGINGTPLIVASMGGHLKMVQYLVRAGADIEACYQIESYDGDITMNAYKAAEQNQHKDIADYLREQGGSLPMNVNCIDRDHDTNKHQLFRHIKSYLGPNNELSLGEVIPLSKVFINVQVIPPQPAKDYLTLVTTGVSDCEMNAPRGKEQERYAELFIKLPSQWPLSNESLCDDQHYWPFKWLRNAGHIPHLQNFLLTEGTIIEGTAHDYPRFRSMLICRSPDTECPRLTCCDGTIINFFQVIPIYLSEQEYAVRRGYRSLLQLLRRKSDWDVVNVDRPPVV